jgi:hypothetical protein
MIWMAMAAVALALTWCAFLRPRAEPKYQGRYLSQWLALYDHAGDTTAAHAVQVIGTNALPYFIEWMRYQPTARTLSSYDNLPAWLQENRTVRSFLFVQAQHAHYAVSGFRILGTNAAPAIPELTALMSDPKNRSPWVGPSRPSASLVKPRFPCCRMRSQIPIALTAALLFFGPCLS